MELVLGVYPLNLTTAFALSPGSADQWVEAHVVPWISTVNITTLAVSQPCSHLGDPVTLLSKCNHHHCDVIRSVTSSFRRFMGRD